MKKINIRLYDESNRPPGRIYTTDVAFAGKLFSVHFVGIMSTTDFNEKLNKALEKATGLPTAETETIYKSSLTPKRVVDDDYDKDFV